MDNALELLSTFHEDESGATTTEYVILLVVLALGLIAVITTFGDTLANTFSNAKDQLKSSVQQGGARG
jgi:Flp pilus assembly pilin Flp